MPDGPQELHSFIPSQRDPHHVAQNFKASCTTKFPRTQNTVFFFFLGTQPNASNIYATHVFCVIISQLKSTSRTNHG